ncbi:tyrosine--tRNA ligase [Micrococcales bacterium 31B]|nr:tyrosine--tRNA ligase [Micrococcales bacterium 31B]
MTAAAPFAGVFEELQWRGLVHQTTDVDALRTALNTTSVTFYCGFDPTAPSLHMGNLVQLIVMRHLQRAGHKPLVLVGGSTGQIGDPKMTSERNLNDLDTVANWVSSIQQQVRPFVSWEGDNAARMVNNLDWTAPISALEFLRDFGKHFRVNQMIKKEAVAARLESHEGISYTEFSYQILQALDYLSLYREYGCTLQTGGADQWGNLTAGTDLIGRAEPDAKVHAMSVPLVTKADGTKFGKSEGGAIWLSADMCSPYRFYQFWINAEDEKVVDYLKIFTSLGPDRIGELELAVKERAFAREAQRVLAEEVTTLVHGAEVVESVQAASAALFGKGDLTALDERTLRDALEELPQAALEGDAVEFVDVMIAAGFAKGKADARRTIAEGGAYLNNVRVESADHVVRKADLLHGALGVLRKGKKNFAALELT